MFILLDAKEVDASMLVNETECKIYAILEIKWKQNAYVGIKELE